ncbi:hypothetical protein C8F01DRAFT_1247233 [Mycena amicta]|nr:hypothetical protein C8F01DRAFT_1247233 [Mycena amicta]
MPLTLFQGNDRCYRCDQPGTLRRCARCQIALYCSQECQKQDWKPIHKAVCFDREERFSPKNLSGDDNPLLDVYLKELAKWIQVWKDPLLVWGLFAANLANQMPDYLTDHCYYVILERRPPKDSSTHSRFQATMGGMRADSEVLAELHTVQPPDYGQQLVQDFHRIPHQKNFLRFVVSLPACRVFSMAGDLVDNLIALVGAQFARLTDALRGESRLLCVALSAAWQEQFAEHLRTGNTTGHVTVFQSVQKSLEAHAKKMADVD